VKPRRRSEDGSQQHASAAADIDEPAERREVVGVDDVAGLLGGPARHRRLEGGLVIGVVFEIGEERLAVDVLERCATGANGIQQARRRSVVEVGAGLRRSS
jgi:hypothetical protein